jgi:hypothetical protein
MNQMKPMKTKGITLTTLALLPVTLFTCVSCSSTPKPPPPVGSSEVSFTKGVPGGVIVQTFQTTATVTAIDQTKRMATLLEPEGKKFIVKVGPEAVNFDRVGVGDQVHATVVQKIVASLDQGDTTAVAGAATAVARAPKGDQPAGLVAESTQLTARIMAIDSEKRTVTLRFEDGNIQPIPIRRDVDLSRFKVGEQALFRVTEIIAIRVEKTQ